MKSFIRMAFAAMSISLVAFSCDKYDDSALRESIEDLKDRVETLEEQVTANVAALQSIVSLGSVQSCEFDAQAGKAVITLLDGKTLSVDMTVEGCSLLSVMEVEGEYYWGVCDEGKTSQLLVGGKPVPVTVTPDLKLSDEGEWMISADGGKTWVATGIFDQEGSAPSFFKDVKEDGDNLVFTLMNGTEVKVAVVGESKFEAAQTSLYFSKEGLEKNIVLQVNNVKAYTITEKPEGWKARIDHDAEEDSHTLVITSPADLSEAVKTGTVKVLGLFNGGQNPEIISIDVAYEEPFILSRGVGAAVNVSVAEHSFEDITGYIVGAVKAVDFNAETVAAWLNTEEGYLSECHVEAKTFAVADIVEEYDAAEAYVVYAVEQIPVMQMLAGTDSYKAEDLQIVEVGSSKAKAGISNIKYDSAYLSLEFNGLTGYFGGCSELGFWESIGRDNVLESLKVGNFEPMNAPYYEGPVNLFPDGVESTQILPSTDYVVWIMPEAEDGIYEAEDFIIYSFTSSPVVEDKTLATPSCQVTDVTYGGFTAKVTPAAGAYKTYAAIRKVSSVPEDLLQSVNELIDINHFSSGSSELTVFTDSFTENDEVCLLAVSLTEDGRFGNVYRQTVPLKTLQYSDDISVSASSKVHGLGDVTVSFEFAGTPSTISYYCTSSSYFGDETLQDMLARGQLGEAVYDKEISTLEDASIELTGLIIGLQYSFYALVKDGTGTPSSMTKITFTPIVLMDYILSGAADYKYGMPVISGSKSGNKYDLNITKPAECVRYWVFMGDFEYMTGSSTNPNIADEYGATDKLVTMQMESLGALELEESYTTTYSPLRVTTRLYMSWLDDKGNYHIIYTHNPNK